MGINHCWVPGADTNSRTTLLPLVLTEEPIRVLRHSVRALHIYKKEKGTPKPCLPQIGLFPVVSGSQIEGESCASQSSSFMVYFSEKSWAFGILLTELACVGFGEDFLSVLLLFCFCCFFFFLYFTACIVLHCQWTTELLNPFHRFICLWIRKRDASSLVVLCCMLVMLAAFIMLLFFPGITSVTLSKTTEGKECQRVELNIYMKKQLIFTK